MLSKQTASTTFFPMGKLDKSDRNFLRLDLISGKVINSDCAKLLSNMLEQKCGIKSASSYFYTSAPYEQIGIVIWTYENQASEKILQQRHYKHLYSNDDFFDDICECTLNAIRFFSQEKYEHLKELLNKQIASKNNQVFLYVNIISFERQYLSFLYSKTSAEIDAALKRKFPQYQDFNYATRAVTDDIKICSYPLLLFFKPEDLEKAIICNHLDEMTIIIKDIIKSNDNMNLFDSESFIPQVYSRRDLSTRVLDDIDNIIQFAKDGIHFTFMPF